MLALSTALRAFSRCSPNKGSSTLRASSRASSIVRVGGGGGSCGADGADNERSPDAIVTPAAITGSAAGISSRPFKVPLQHGVHDDVFGFAVPDDGLPLNAFPCEPQLLGQPDRGGVLLRYPQDDPVEAKHLEREAKGPPSGPVGESPSPALGYGDACFGLAVLLV